MKKNRKLFWLSDQLNHKCQDVISLYAAAGAYKRNLLLSLPGHTDNHHYHYIEYTQKSESSDLLFNFENNSFQKTE